MQEFEYTYAALVQKVLSTGKERVGRNGTTVSLFGEQLKIKLNGDMTFPILQGRKMYPGGVFGELAAMLRKPTHIKDFKVWGCNYWDTWAKPDGFITVDYGNAWHANGQIERLKHSLRTDPTDRRMIISGWRPENLNDLDLPCCHMMYQFYVRDGKYLDILWSQRSVDMMVGLPSDIIFAAAWLIAIANEFGFMPGEITMSLGDCHVYEEHFLAANKYLGVVTDDIFATPALRLPTYRLNMASGKDFCAFEPTDIALSVYTTHPKLDLELKA
jgi:thymidylate synthase